MREKNAKSADGPPGASGASGAPRSSGRPASPGVRDRAASLFTRVTLLARLRGRRDDHAWADFDARYAGLIRSIAGSLGLRGEAADDLVQDVRIALLRSMPRFRYDRERGSFRGYLHTIVRRTAWRRWRRAAREQAALRSLAADRDAWTEQFEAAWEAGWQRRRLAEGMAAIEHEFSPRDRAVFAAYAVSGRAADDVADEFGVSVNQVHQVRSRVVRRLRATVQATVEAEGQGDGDGDGGDDVNSDEPAQ